MYSAMILSVKGVMSRFNRSSILLTVPFSDLTANTLNLEELLAATFLFCFNNREFHIFAVMGLALVEGLVILICHCVEGAKICAISSIPHWQNNTNMIKDLFFFFMNYMIKDLEG